MRVLDSIPEVQDGIKGGLLYGHWPNSDDPQARGLTLISWWAQSTCSGYQASNWSILGVLSYPGIGPEYLGNTLGSIATEQHLASIVSPKAQNLHFQSGTQFCQEYSQRVLHARKILKLIISYPLRKGYKQGKRVKKRGLDNFKKRARVLRTESKKRETENRQWKGTSELPTLTLFMRNFPLQDTLSPTIINRL